MQDPWNPTATDLRQWAAESDSLCPSEDWDLAVTGIGHEALFINLVEDKQCLKADFFLHCLYLWVYDTVRVSGKTDELERMLQRGEASTKQALRIWARRSRALISNPRRADKDLWWEFGQNRGGTVKE